MTAAPFFYSTCPPSVDFSPTDYAERVGLIARWSEAAGCEGVLVYSDNRLADPFLVAQLVVQATDRLVPLVALQPVYLHPFSTAKAIATLAGWYGRRIDLNLIAGGFKNDLIAMGDDTPHDDRYLRLEEYARCVQGILESAITGRGFSFSGRYFKLENLKLSLPMSAELLPRLLVSGSSEAGRATARALRGWEIQYPLPATGYQAAADQSELRLGLRVGMIARDQDDAAWREARERFPEDRRGEIAHQLAMKISDSVWHQQLSEAASESADSPYWLHPFQSYKTFCPYLVGSHEAVAAELRKYRAAGFRAFILDVPGSEAELASVMRVFQLADQGRTA